MIRNLSELRALVRLVLTESFCPTCSDPDAYITFREVEDDATEHEFGRGREMVPHVECPNVDCKHFNTYSFVKKPRLTPAINRR